MMAMSLLPTKSRFHGLSRRALPYWCKSIVTSLRLQNGQKQSETSVSLRVWCQYYVTYCLGYCFKELFERRCHGILLPNTNRPWCHLNINKPIELFYYFNTLWRIISLGKSDKNFFSNDENKSFKKKKRNYRKINY